MGCVSSKIMTRSGSINEEVKHSLQRVNGLEELLVTKNGGDQFLALLCTANTVARKLKAGSPTHEPEAGRNAPLELIDSSTINTEKPDCNTNPPVELTNIETINTWELLAGLEEGNKEEWQEKPQQQLRVEGISTVDLPSTSFRTTEEYKFIVDNYSVPSQSSHSSKEKPEDGVVHTRSFHTVEEYDAMVARNHSLEEGKYATAGSESSIKECTANSAHLDEVEGNDIEQGDHVELETESNNTTASAKGDVALKNDLTSQKGSRRKAMAKELALLKVPTFEFSKSGSLRDWLLQGGQVFSPGSYVTPKFGDFVSPVTKNGDGGFDSTVFDPEMVAHFEQAMKQLTMQEEGFLKQIIESLEGGNGEGISRIANTAEDIQM